MARLLASIGEYLYSTDDEGVWVNLYAQGTAQVKSLGLTLETRTLYPWDGLIELTMQLDAPKTFALRLRMPAWCEQWSLRINSEELDAPEVIDGYIHITREWQLGDVVLYNMEMPALAVRANPLVRQTLGRVAVQRGPDRVLP